MGHDDTNIDSDINNSLPVIDIISVHFLPDDTFQLGLEGEGVHIKSNKVSGCAIRSRGDGNGADVNGGQKDQNGVGYEQKKLDYDLDALSEINRDRDMTAEEFEQILADIQDVYLYPFKTMNDVELRDRVYQLWDLHEMRKEGILELTDIQKGYEKNLSGILRFYLLFLRHKMVGTGEAETINNQNIFNRVLKCIYYMNNILLSEYHIKKTIEDEGMMNQEDSMNLFRFTPQDNSSNRAFQNLLLILLRKAYEKGYRLRGESCYEQIYHNGHPTHAWRYVSHLLDFVYDSIKKETEFEMWKNLTDAKDNAKRAVDYLTNAKDKELPVLKPDRHLFAFTDGIYDAKNIIFYPYESHRLPSDRVAIKFFNQPFNHETLFGVDDWMDIHTPEIDTVLETQELKDDVKRIVYAMMGRCLYDVNEEDKWEVIMFIKGVAGSGKSTLGKILKDFYPSNDVAILSSNVERKFGLHPIFDKLMFLCFEVKANWVLDQADFQCMISGEEVSLAIKHKDAISTLWKVPGMLMGNEVASSWLDAAGSMTRRILLLEFNKKVKVTDTTLSSRMKDNIAAILHKCNIAYQALVKSSGISSIWSSVPQYFRDTQKNLSESINPLEDFLVNNGQLHEDLADPDCCMPLEEFSTLYLKFCRDNNISTRIKFKKDHYGTVFENHGFDVRLVKEREYRGVMKDGVKWVFGIGLKSDNEQENDQIES